ncbi:hypothetical protein [Neorhodopirellula pilleata]|uniref:Uncharacterized protein n=1 Tax=Neorhodopirellula pilleata TaxID=2714738 RepID=A0A5C6A3G8_9BACT|nr:hypothetical protein [Neorhodopirellula pilleata]TWT92953.1 hypothetical protein Pla100_42690 [Neorhodopirellula pilleata]
MFKKISPAIVDRLSRLRPLLANNLSKSALKAAVSEIFAKALGKGIVVVLFFCLALVSIPSGNVIEPAYAKKPWFTENNEATLTINKEGHFVIECTGVHSGVGDQTLSSIIIKPTVRDAIESWAIVGDAYSVQHGRRIGSALIRFAPNGSVRVEIMSDISSEFKSDLVFRSDWGSVSIGEQIFAGEQINKELTTVNSDQKANSILRDDSEALDRPFYR